jgi:glycosyltransferase involved in cell wall biosynthesis
MTVKSLPLITIAMPIKNRVWALPYVLKGIELQDYSRKNIKIVFVDNLSTDGTYEKLGEWARKNRNYYYTTTLLRAEGNIPRLRNICLEGAEGEYVLFWDSDIVAPPFAIKLLLNAAESLGGDIVTVNYVYADEALVPHILEKRAPENVQVERVLGSGMGFTLIRKKVFESIGGFNELFPVGEDTEFSWRAVERGFKILKVDIEVLHLKHRDTLIPRAGQNFKKWIIFNFKYRSKAYFISYKTLPKALKLRILFWLFLPVIILFVFLQPLTGLLILLYVTPAIWLQVKSNRSVLQGLKSFATFSVPTGLALSYGFLFQLLISLVRRLCKIMRKSLLL